MPPGSPAAPRAYPRRPLRVRAILALALIMLGVAWSAAAEAATVTQNGSLLEVAYTATDATPEEVSLVNTGGEIQVNTGQAQATYAPSDITGIRVTPEKATGTAQTLTLRSMSGTWLLPDGVSGGLSWAGYRYRLSGAFDWRSYGVRLDGPITLLGDTALTGSSISPGPVDAQSPGSASLTISSTHSVHLHGAGRTNRLSSLTVSTPFVAMYDDIHTTGAQAYSARMFVLTSGGLTLAGSAVDATGSISLGDADLGARTLTVEQTGASTISSTLFDESATLSVTKAGTGTLALTGPNTYTGATSVTGGTLTIGHNDGLGATSTGTTVSDGARLDLASGITSAEPLTSFGGSTLASLGSGSFSGTVTMAGATTVDVPSGATLNMSGTIAGVSLPRTLTKTGAGMLTRGGSSTNLRIDVAAGTLEAGATSVGSAVTVANGAHVQVNAGTYTNAWTISGSGGASGSAVRVRGNREATFSGPISLAADAAIGSGVFRGSPSGAVLTLAGAIDNLPGTGAHALTFVGPDTTTVTSTIGANPFADPDVPALSAVSASAPMTISGGTVTTSGSQSYAGGLSLGADLTVQASTLTASGRVSTAGGVPAATLSMSHSGSSTITGDIEGGVALAKDGGGTLTLSGTNTYTGGTTITSGALRAGSATALGATSAGTTVGTDATLEVNEGISSAEPITANANSLLTARGSGAALTGSIALAGTPEVYAPPVSVFTLGGSLSGSGGLRTTGSGTVVLGGSSTYSGLTAVDTGTVRVANGAALGATGTGTTVATGTRLEIGSGVTTSEPVGTTGAGAILSLQGGSGGMAGAISLGGATTVDVPAGGTLTASGGIGQSGTRGLTKTGDGVLALAAASTFTGATAVTAGTLRLDSPAALDAATTVTVGAGAGAEIATSATFANAWSLAGSGPAGQGALSASIGATALLGGPIEVTGAVSILSHGVLSLDGPIDSAPGGAGSLTIGGMSPVAVAGPVGGTRALASFTAGTALTLFGDVTTSGGQLFGSTITLADAGVTLTASRVEGNGAFVNGRWPATPTTLTLDQSGDATFAGQIGRTADTSAQRDIHLVKKGSGTLTLSGVNAMTGATDLQAGGIFMGAGGRLDTSAITAAPSTSVDGAGTITGSVTFTGSGPGGLFPRTSTGPARLTTGAVTGAAGRILSFDVPRAGTPGTDYSRLDVNGAIDLNGVGIWTPAFTGDIGDTVTIIHATGGVTGQFNSGTSNQGWRIDYRPNDVDLVYVGQAPVIHGVSPASGPTAGGTTVTITGLSFTPSASVAIGGAPCASLAIVSSTEMRCTTPAHAPGAVAVVVTNEAGSTAGADPFTYVAPAPDPSTLPSGGGGSHDAAPGPSGGAAAASPGGRVATATVARPRYGAARRTVTTAVVTTGPGRLTQVITSRNGKRSITRCTTTRVVGSGPTALTCRVNAGRRAALKRGGAALTVVTTWTPVGGTPQATIATLPAPRR